MQSGDGDVVLPGAHVVDWGLEAIDGGVVFAGPQTIRVGCEAIDDGRQAVDVGCETVDEGDIVDEVCEAAEVDLDVEDRDEREYRCPCWRLVVELGM